MFLSLVTLVALGVAAPLAILGSRLLAVSAGDDDHAGPAEAATSPLTGRLRLADTGWVVEVSGAAGGAVLVVVDGQPVALADLDDEGHASLEGVVPEGQQPSVRLVPLPRSGILLRPGGAVESPIPQPTATAVPPATPTPPPTRAPPSPVPAVAATPARSATPTGSSAGPSPPILHLVQDAGPRLAITFDGGASGNGTDELLDLLRRLDLKATLFVTGEFIERHPATVRRALRDGHEVGNHTFDHPHLTTYAANRRHDLVPEVTRQSFHDQLRRTEEAFRAATGHGLAPLWRAPYGEENRTLRGWALELGYLHVRWSSLRGASLDSRDWVDDEHSRLYQDADRMVARLLRFPHLGGGIVLMHLASDRPTPPWRALPDFVDSLDDRGIEPVRVSELLSASRIWRPWLERAEARHRAVWGED